MEIDITSFFNDAEPFDYSASVMERGENAARKTWGNAKQHGAESPLLTTAEQLEALRLYVKGFGAWSENEIRAWDDVECNALFIQLISGNMREIEYLCTNDDGKIDWSEYERLGQEGIISSNLFRGDDGRIYYHLGE